MANISALTSTANPSLAIGPNGATNPTIQTDSSVASAATGIKVIGRAATAGADIVVTSSGTNEPLKIDAKGSGTVTIAGTSTGAIALGQNTAVTGTFAASGDVAINTDKLTVAAASGNTAAAGSILSTSATGGVGYATGAGGAVEQATSRTTGVTLNKATGAITLVSAAGSATPASFTVTNSVVAATDVIALSQKSGTDKYVLAVTAVGAGSFEVTSYTTGGTTTEQPVFNFAVLKGVAA